MHKHEDFRLASDPRTSPAILSELAASSFVEVRSAVAQNPSTSQKTLLSLVGDNEPTVIEELIKNPSILNKNINLNYCHDVSLSLVTKEDAAFILSLRMDQSKNSHVSSVSSSLESQKIWIEHYKVRESTRTEFYFIVNDVQNDNIGTIRIYNLKPGCFCWGSWIIQSEGNIKAPLASVISMYEFAFYTLGFKQCHFDVRNSNIMVINFHKKMGASIVSKNEIDTFFDYSAEQYEAFKLKNKKMLSKILL